MEKLLTLYKKIAEIATVDEHGSKLTNTINDFILNEIIKDKLSDIPKPGNPLNRIWSPASCVPNKGLLDITANDSNLNKLLINGGLITLFNLITRQYPKPNIRQVLDTLVKIDIEINNKDTTKRYEVHINDYDECSGGVCLFSVLYKAMVKLQGYGKLNKRCDVAFRLIGRDCFLALDLPSETANSIVTRTLTDYSHTSKLIKGFYIETAYDNLNSVAKNIIEDINITFNWYMGLEAPRKDIATSLRDIVYRSDALYISLTEVDENNKIIDRHTLDTATIGGRYSELKIINYVKSVRDKLDTMTPSRLRHAYIESLPAREYLNEMFFNREYVIIEAFELYKKLDEIVHFFEENKDHLNDKGLFECN